MAVNCEGFAIGWPKYEPPKMDLDHLEILGRLVSGVRPNPTTFNYKKVIFNDPATIVIWEDGTKTVVKCAKGEVFDPVKGLAIAFMKHVLGDENKHNKVIRKEAVRYYIDTKAFSKLGAAVKTLEGIELFGEHLNDSDPM